LRYITLGWATIIEEEGPVKQAAGSLARRAANKGSDSFYTFLLLV